PRNKYVNSLMILSLSFGRQRRRLRGIRDRRKCVGSPWRAVRFAPRLEAPLQREKEDGPSGRCLIVVLVRALETAMGQRENCAAVGRTQVEGDRRGFPARDRRRNRYRLPPQAHRRPAVVEPQMGIDAPTDHLEPRRPSVLRPESSLSFPPPLANVIGR